MKRFPLLLCALLALVGLPALAQAWPTKPVRIVLQFPPGGSTDSVARILAQPLAAALGQPVVIENRPGADGAIAGEFVARAEPDGHTFFLASNTPMMQVPLLKKNPPYDPVRSFTPVSLVGRYVYVMVSSPALPAKDVGELLAYARANPGKLGYGSYSGVTQLMHNQLKMAKADTTLVPYKGEAPTVTDILGNHVQFTFATPASTLQHVKEGKLRALAVLLPARSSLLPSVPTAAEAGLPPLNAGTWAALFGPARLPAEIAQRMNRELNAAMQRPEVREKITALGFELAGSTPDEMGLFLQEQLQAWGRAFRDAGMNPE
ncbi:MAG: tripartite tricarboxylate transporter substrate binding protein [Burkholderiaceae bacterium]|nr:tripartite tricarboxylate transporter substrate binding protein [Burkholderiaceae bacterium]